MATKVLDLGGRFQNAFGFVGGTGESLQETNINDSLSGANVVVKDGRSTFEEFTLERPGVILKFAYTGLIKEIDDVFAPPPLVTFKMSKRIGETIVSTNDQKGNELSFGQVVEQYGSSPIDISIRGVLIDMVNHQYPSKKVETLTQLFRYNGSWEVAGEVFRNKGIQSLYFTNLDDGGVQGFMDTWSYTLEARSIKPVQYFIIKK